MAWFESQPLSSGASACYHRDALEKGWWSQLSDGNSERPIRVFVSSAGVLHDERLLVVRICRQLSQAMGISIEPLLWEGGGKEEPDVPSFSARVSGEGAQYEIDKVLEEIGGCDIYVGMIWHRMGTPTGEYKSGTEAEYRAALQERGEGDRPEILFYRKTADLPHSVEPEQLAAAQEFASEIEGDGLMQRFEDEDDLNRQLFTHLAEAIRRVRPEEDDTKEPPDPSPPSGTTPIPPQPHFAHPYPLQPNFTGRVSERTMLTKWLTKGQQPVLALVAFGGMGKSALAWAWLLRDVLGLPLPGAVADKPKDAEACRVPEDTRPEGVFWWSFYERDSTFEGFLDKALAYAAGGHIPEGVEGAYEKMEALVNLLREKRLLLVLDGFERQLRQYASMAAVYQEDEEGEVPAEDRACADPNAATFLRRLAGGPFQSRILLNSRLFPKELEADGGEAVANCTREDLTSMEPKDAVAFFQAQGIKGNRGEIQAACSPYGYHPLALRLLAGVIVNDKQTPGDVRAAERHGLLEEPTGERLRQILEFAYDALDRHKRALLSRIAAFRSPVDYNTVSIFKTKKIASQFDAALDDLNDRGLLLFDKEGASYDLHPVVRRYVYERLNGKRGVHEKLAKYYSGIAVPEEKELKSLEELAPLIELYHHTVSAGRHDDARGLYYERLGKLLYYQLGAHQVCIELLRSLFPDGVERPPRLANEADQGWALNELANAYGLFGQPRRAIELAERAGINAQEQGALANMATSTRNIGDFRLMLGALASSEADIRKSIELASEAGDEFGKALSHRHMGLVLAYEGRFGEAKQQFAESEAHWQRTDDKRGACLHQSYRTLAALIAGDAATGLEFAQSARTMAEEADKKEFPVERDVVRAEWLIGASLVALAQEGGDQRNEHLAVAEMHLTESLTRCRRKNVVDLEAEILVALARWHRAKANTKESREHGEEALVIADRCEYRLQQADVHNFLAVLEMEEGDRDAAIEHAKTGYERAWCDGPPHCYKPALDEAKRLLDDLGVEPPEMPEYVG